MPTDTEALIEFLKGNDAARTKFLAPGTDLVGFGMALRDSDNRFGLLNDSRSVGRKHILDIGELINARAFFTTPPPPHPEGPDQGIGPNVGGEDGVVRPGDTKPGASSSSASAGGSGLLLLGGGLILALLLLKKK